MLDTYIFDTVPRDTAALRRCCVAYLVESNQEAEINTFNAFDIAELPEQVTLYMVESKNSDGFRELLKKVRDNNSNNPIVLSFQNLNELMGVLTPEIRPSGLISKPIDKDVVRELLKQIDAHFTGDDGQNTDDFAYSIKAREYRIPKNKILFFESRSKKIVARTQNQEYEFYDSLDNLEKQMEDSFVRTHRSFLVNKAHIHVVDFAAMSITLDDGSEVLISRTYKSALKDGGV